MSEAQEKSTGDPTILLNSLLQSLRLQKAEEIATGVDPKTLKLSVPAAIFAPANHSIINIQMSPD